MDWQPIETAPRDGTKVLLWIPFIELIQGQWRRPFDNDDYGEWVDIWNNEPIAHGTGDAAIPTHWMPRPASPSTPHGGEKS